MVNFKYDKSKDIWCILNKGKASNNSSNPTKVYELLVKKYGDDPSEENVSDSERYPFLKTTILSII